MALGLKSRFGIASVSSASKKTGPRKKLQYPQNVMRHLSPSRTIQNHYSFLKSSRAVWHYVKWTEASPWREIICVACCVWLGLCVCDCANGCVYDCAYASLLEDISPGLPGETCLDYHDMTIHPQCCSDQRSIAIRFWLSSQHRLDWIPVLDGLAGTSLPLVAGIWLPCTLFAMLQHFNRKIWNWYRHRSSDHSLASNMNNHNSTFASW